MCGILGILANKGPISNLLYDGLLVLQHRGQDAAGIVVCDEDKLHLRKDNGLVNDVFEKEIIGLWVQFRHHSCKKHTSYS